MLSEAPNLELYFQYGTWPILVFTQCPRSNYCYVCTFDHSNGYSWSQFELHCENADGHAPPLCIYTDKATTHMDTFNTRDQFWADVLLSSSHLLSDVGVVVLQTIILLFVAHKHANEIQAQNVSRYEQIHPNGFEFLRNGVFTWSRLLQVTSTFGIIIVIIVLRVAHVCGCDATYQTWHFRNIQMHLPLKPMWLRCHRLSLLCNTDMHTLWASEWVNVCLLYIFIYVSLCHSSLLTSGLRFISEFDFHLFVAPCFPLGKHKI